MVIIFTPNKVRHVFKDAQEADQWLKENGITDVEVITPTYMPQLPAFIEDFYDRLNYTPAVARYAPKSGQERRRERRAKERKKNKR